MAHCPNVLWAFTFRHPCLPSPMGKEGSKAKLLKISRKADRDAPCDQARMLDSVRTEVLHDAKPTNERRLALGLRLKQGCFSCLPRVLQGCKTDQANNIKHPIYFFKEVFLQSESPYKVYGAPACRKSQLLKIEQALEH